MLIIVYKSLRNNETSQTVNIKYTYKCKFHKLLWKEREKSNIGNYHHTMDRSFANDIV